MESLGKVKNHKAHNHQDHKTKAWSLLEWKKTKSHELY